VCHFAESRFVAVLKTTAITVSLLVAVATSAAASDPLLRISGRSELPLEFRFRVYYIAQSDDWLCTRYSFNAGRRLAKNRTHDYTPTIANGEYSLDVPLDAEDPESGCGWWPRYVFLCVGSLCTDVAALAVGSYTAAPVETVLGCSIVPRTQDWLCIDSDAAERNRDRTSEHISVDIQIR